MKHCPVCKIDLPEPMPSLCPQCGWDLANDLQLVPSLGELPDFVLNSYKERFALATRTWRERLECNDERRRLKEGQGRIEENMRGIQAELRWANERMSGFNDQMASVNGQITGFKDQMSGVKVQMSGFNDQMWSVKDQISGVKDQVSVLHGAHGQGQAQVDRQMKQLADLCTILQKQMGEIKEWQEAAAKTLRLLDERTRRPGEIWREPVTGMELLWIPAGCFQMGSPESEKERGSDEGPRHEVCLDGFWLGKYPLTQGQWQKVMGSNPSSFKKGDNYPVESVSWQDAREFIKKLTAMNGGQYKFRLPTEAEWEYACRAGTTTPFYFGETIGT